jgi:hypothetical protein
MNGFYPRWICKDCGDLYGRGPWFTISTWHPDLCGICGKYDLCTEPRDCRHLRETFLLGMQVSVLPRGADPYRCLSVDPRGAGRWMLPFLENLDRALTASKDGPILSVTVAGMTFDRAENGAFIRRRER